MLEQDHKLQFVPRFVHIQNNNTRITHVYFTTKINKQTNETTT